VGGFRKAATRGEDRVSANGAGSPARHTHNLSRSVVGMSRRDGRNHGQEARARFPPACPIRTRSAMPLTGSRPSARR